MIQERTEPLIAHAMEDDVEDYLFYTRQEEGAGFCCCCFFFIFDYFSAYRVTLGNYCFSYQNVIRRVLVWEINPKFSSYPYQWIKVNENILLIILARFATSGDYLVKGGFINTACELRFKS